MVFFYENSLFTNMDANGEVLGKLIKAKENIKRKYSELKHGKANIHSQFNQFRFHLFRKQMIIKILFDRLRLLLASKAADCFTKFAWAIALKSKTAKEVSNTMSKILFKRSPKLLQVDNGKEFYNSTFDALMEKHNILKYSTYSTMKACIIERINRTLKEKMFREFTARGSHEWISILPSLINEYNNSKHRTIGMTPEQADTNQTSVVIKQRKIINGKIKFNVGDNVRISTYKCVLTKGYLPSWSTEIFKIFKINDTLPTTYQLQDYTG
ncbi:hypothetical protein AGLY_017582 [Aphis glycines]|uniref:Integrase catalytic domain-containing protein n=1 Tax=Aphis glycines TaxID=307491 RepID=A0A6G0SUF2_APHGL|nr:hypothetical protein AGLY_017582 [Aphis glycines]